MPLFTAYRTLFWYSYGIFLNKNDSQINCPSKTFPWLDELTVFLLIIRLGLPPAGSLQRPCFRSEAPAHVGVFGVKHEMLCAFSYGGTKKLCGVIASTWGANSQRCVSTPHVEAQAVERVWAEGVEKRNRKWAGAVKSEIIISQVLLHEKHCG